MPGADEMAKPKHAFLVALAVHLATAIVGFIFLSYLAQPENIVSDVSLGPSFRSIPKRIVGSLLMSLVFSVPVFGLGLLAKGSRKSAS